MQNKTELHSKLKKYVNHSFMVYKNSKNPGYKTMKRAKALDMTLGIVRGDAFNHLSEKSLATLILSRQTFLKDIIPAFYNPSYESSLFNLNEIITEATNINERSKAMQFV